MSLEAKFAELKIADVSSIVDAVKKDGVSKSGLVAGLEALKARCESNETDEAIAALSTVKALVEECPSAHAYTKECLTACKFARVVETFTEHRVSILFRSIFQFVSLECFMFLTRKVRWLDVSMVATHPSLDSWTPFKRISSNLGES